MPNDDSEIYEKLEEKLDEERTTITYEAPYIPSFSETRVIGNTAKEIVRTLLSKAGYRVYPFGYESYFTAIKDLVHQGKFDDANNPEIVEKIRFMPDLVVMDPDMEEIELVEVKFRNEDPSDVSLKPKTVKGYEKHWPESRLVCVTPYKCHKEQDSDPHFCFYTCKIDEIREKARDTSYWPDKSEEREGIVDVEFGSEDALHYYFPRLSHHKDELEKMRRLVRNVLKDWKEGLDSD